MKSIDTILKDIRNPAIFIDAQHGLGNRMRAIGSAAAIAKKTNRQLVIVWQPDHHCNCQFKDLFNYNDYVINTSLGSSVSAFGDYYNYMEIETGSVKGEHIDTSTDAHIFVKAGEVLNSEHSSWNNENVFLKTLEPVDTVKQLIYTINTTDVIGAHVRMEAGKNTDSHSYDSADNWSEESHRLLHEWRAKSHYKHFITRINSIIQDSKSDQKIFLATDVPYVYDKFRNQYGDRLLYLPRDVYDRGLKQIRFALADVYLMSQCQKLLCSTWSSFSEYAMRLATHTNFESSGADF